LGEDLEQLWRKNLIADDVGLLLFFLPFSLPEQTGGTTPISK
jgi:hypothetical protein